VGTTAKYAAGWENIFGGKKSVKAAGGPTKKAASPKKKASPAKKKGKK
jgi:hypothetical protein